MKAGGGAFVSVVGPSGAGKDTIIAFARKTLEADRSFRFVRRLVTRPSDAFEDHGTISEAEFQTGVEGGVFALSWRAHGLGYAVPIAARQAVDDGDVAICNLSRTAIGAARTLFPRLVVVQVEASPDIIAARLATRGREGKELVAARLERKIDDVVFAADRRIVNDGAPEEAAAEFVGVLREIRDRQAAPAS